jgi:methionyl-tRNA formyltransferase
MKAVIVTRYPRVDTPSWKRRLAEGLQGAGFDVAALYSRSHTIDQARAGLKENGLQVLKRYASLRGGSDDSAEGPTTLASWLEHRGARVIYARRLDEPDALEGLRALDPDLLILAGADIVPAAVLEVPQLGTINPHYGLLPGYRGMNVTEWSVFHGDPIGVTVHLVDTGIDTGDILMQEEIPLEPGDTFERLRTRHQDVATRLLVEAAVELRDGTARRVPQRAGEGRQYYRMHPLLRRVAENRLAQAANPG